MTGSSPFHDTDEAAVCGKILSVIDAAKFPASRRMSKDCTANRPVFTWPSLIKSLCRTEPSERLVARPGGIQNLEQDGWYLAFPWSELDARTIEAPWEPQHKSPVPKPL